MTSSSSSSSLSTLDGKKPSSLIWTTWTSETKLRDIDHSLWPLLIYSWLTRFNPVYPATRPFHEEIKASGPLAWFTMTSQLRSQLEECMERKDLDGCMKTELGGLTVTQFIGQAHVQLKDRLNSMTNYGEILGDNFEMIPLDTTLARDRLGDPTNTNLMGRIAPAKPTVEVVEGLKRMRQWLANQFTNKEHVHQFMEAIWLYYHQMSGGFKKNDSDDSKDKKQMSSFDFSVGNKTILKRKQNENDDESKSSKKHENDDGESILVLIKLTADRTIYQFVSPIDTIGQLKQRLCGLLPGNPPIKGKLFYPPIGHVEQYIVAEDTKVGPEWRLVPGPSSILESSFMQMKKNKICIYERKDVNEWINRSLDMNLCLSLNHSDDTIFRNLTTEVDRRQSPMCQIEIRVPTHKDLGWKIPNPTVTWSDTGPVCRELDFEPTLVIGTQCIKNRGTTTLIEGAMLKSRLYVRKVAKGTDFSWCMGYLPDPKYINSGVSNFYIDISKSHDFLRRCKILLRDCTPEDDKKSDWNDWLVSIDPIGSNFYKDYCSTQEFIKGQDYTVSIQEYGYSRVASPSSPTWINASIDWKCFVTIV